jgi:hypothetical protein
MKASGTATKRWTRYDTTPVPVETYCSEFGITIEKGKGNQSNPKN